MTPQDQPTQADPGPLKTVVHDFRWAARTNPVVAAVLKAGGGAESCVVALVEQQELLTRRLMELEAIAPRKVKVGHETYIWRCPDHLIP